MACLVRLLQRVPRGCACTLILPLLLGCTILLIVLIVDRSDWYSWCSTEINAGDCEIYEDDHKTCFCIDGDKPNNRTQSLELYKQANENCATLNGTLATADTKDKLLWLSKRMYTMGVDNTYIGLIKDGTSWKWNKTDGLEDAKNIIWHPDYPPNTDDTRALLTVQTVQQFKSSDQYGYEYTYFNYDYYIENDRSFQWFGFTTMDKINVYNSNGYFYYICHYISQPSIMLQTTTTTQMSVLVQDECYCSSNEQISLRELDQSQTFQSPRYPSNYCSDVSCRWVIKTEDDLVVKLEWMVFNTEDEMDFVYVFDGGTDHDPMIHECSGSHCFDAVSSSNSLHVHFNADHVTTDLGFKGRVTATKNDPCYCTASAKITLPNLVDSYTIYSPKYPRTYCEDHNCKWTITVPQDHGLKIIWSEFGIEEFQDVVFVYDGQSDKDRLFLNCTGASCGSAISSGRNIHIHFVSDSHSSLEPGFVGVVNPVVNYCEKTGPATPLGYVSYSEEHDEGRIPMGETAILNCPTNSKINGTLEDVNDTITCDVWVWNREFSPCVKVCNMKQNHGLQNLSDVHVCTLEQNTDARLVADNHTVTVQRYDLLKEQKLEPQYFTCTDSSWMPNQPFCDVGWIGILIIAGHKTYDDYNMKEKFFLSSIDLYNPLENKTVELNAKLKVGRRGHVAAVLSDGRVLVTAGNKPGWKNQATQDTEIIDITSGEVQDGPNLNIGRDAPATAHLDDEIWMCGGYGENSCEVFKGDHWVLEPARMNLERADFALASLGTAVQEIKRKVRKVLNSRVDHSLMAIGGWLMNESRTTETTEIYSKISEQWSFSAPMHKKRYALGAATYKANVYACGGGEEIHQTMSECERYQMNSDTWEQIANMKVRRDHFSMVVFADKMYAVNGDFKTVEYYDDHKNVWVMLGKQLALVRHFTAVVGFPALS